MALIKKQNKVKVSPKSGKNKKFINTIKTVNAGSFLSKNGNKNVEAGDNVTYDEANKSLVFN